MSSMPKEGDLQSYLMTYDMCCLSGFACENTDLSKRQYRSAIATRDFVPGDIIFKSYSYASSLDNDKMSDYCAYCFSRIHTARKLRCSKCHKNVYCNTTCQRCDWNEVHKVECKILLSLSPETDEKESIAVQDDAFPLLLKSSIKTLIGLTSHIESGRTIESTTCTVQNTTGHVNCTWLHALTMSSSSHLLKVLDCKIYEAIVATVSKYLMSASFVKKSSYLTEAFVSQLVFRLYFSSFSNNFSISDELMFSRGSAVIPHAAILNHSCHPNALMTYMLKEGMRPQVVCRAVREIKEGQEVRHSYVDLSFTTKMRLSSLSNSYGFTCQCNRCFDIPEASSEDLNDLKTLLREHINNPLLLKSLLDARSEMSASQWQQVTEELQNELSGGTIATECIEIESIADVSKHTQARLMEHLLRKDGDDESDVHIYRGLVEKSLETYTDLGLYHIINHSIRGHQLSELLLRFQLTYADKEMSYSEDSEGFEDYKKVVDLLISLCESIVSYLLVTFTGSGVVNHPLLALQLCTLGDMYLYKGDEGKAMQCFEWVLVIQQVVGSEGDMLSESALQRIQDSRGGKK